MSGITLQVLEGLDRGRIYTNLPLPIRIGREDDNELRLNDERVSRFHAKIQRDNSHVILTDLESTNGTRVNGSPVQMRILRPGDLVQIGRCLLLYGSSEEIRQMRSLVGSDSALTDSNGSPPAIPDRDLTLDGSHPDVLEHLGGVFPGGPPGLPESLGITQRAQLADLLLFLHDQIGRVVVQSSEAADPARQQVIPWNRWQDLLSLHRTLSDYLRKIGDPEDG